VRRPSDVPRVVSLVPSVTETLLAWEVFPVAVTRFCEAPGMPTVGGTKNPDVAAIVALRPDLVVMDKEENRSDDADALQGSGLTVHVTHVRAVNDVAPTLADLAVVLGLPEVPGAAEVPGEAEVPGGALGAGPAATRPRAWVPIWRRPWMTINAATYGSSILEAAGIVNVYEDASDPYPTVTLEEAAALDPDVVLAPSEPYPFAERHRSQLEEVAPVVFVDGQDLFWWGSRTPAAVSRLRQLASELASQ
jgi:ABC-type Fe3+-hydroxamate transport system substrate-binding protein